MVIILRLNYFLKTFMPDAKALKVFLVLKDKQWHCRECEYEHVGSLQIAGSGGIKGLRNGSNRRPGIVIESENRFGPECNKNTRQDRWDGNFQPQAHEGSMPPRIANRIIAVLRKRDIVENRERPPHELTKDHKFPRKRWSTIERERQTDYTDLTDEDIRAGFQLLKKSNGSGNHNLLKSRACERCFDEGKRGTPLDIEFFYAGDENWAGATENDPRGCIGCGWFDFGKWREELNKHIRNTV